MTESNESDKRKTRSVLEYLPETLADEIEDEADEFFDGDENLTIAYIVWAASRVAGKQSFYEWIGGVPGGWGLAKIVFAVVNSLDDDWRPERKS